MEPASILIVDDEPFNLDLLEHLVTVHPGHHDIEEDEIERLGRKPF